MRRLRSYMMAALGLGSSVLPAQSAPPEPNAPHAGIIAAADALLSKRYRQDQPGAAVLLAKNGQTLFRKAYGLASMELQVPLRPEMVFKIGSITKQFTATGVMMLVEEGKVDLRAPITRYLRNTPKKWHRVTVEMLLNHTSGIPSVTEDPAYFQYARKELGARELIHTLVDKKPMDFYPGKDYSYNNTGYLLLGILIENVSKQKWGDFITSRIIKRLDLKNTRVGTDVLLVPGLVHGYTTNANPAPFESILIAGAAGSLYSNVDDLAIFAMALHSGKLIGQGSLSAMLKATSTRDGHTHDYGYGMILRHANGHLLAGHGGLIGGFRSYLEVDVATRSVAVILNNSDAPSGMTSDEYYTQRLLALADSGSMPETR